LTLTNYTINGSHTDEYGNEVFFPSLTVYKISVGNCSQYSSKVLRMMIYDEVRPSLHLNATVEIEAFIYYSSLNATQFNIQYSGNHTYEICIYPNINTTLYSDWYIKYTTGGGFTHRYYLVNQSITNTTLNVSLYNFNTTTGISDLKITSRYRATYNYFNNIYASLQRKYVDEGVWRTVQMDKSGDYGLIFFNIIEETVDYRVIFKDGQNRLLSTSENMKFVCTDDICDITFLLDPYSLTTAATSLGYSITYDNATGNITLTWNDPLGGTSSVRLLVTKELQKTLTICDTTQTGAAGTIICDVSGYTGEVFIRVFSSASPEAPVISQWLRLSTPLLGGLIGTGEGVFWSTGIITTMAAFGAILSPIVAVIGTILALIIIYLLGLFSPITLPFVIIAIIMGIAINIRLKK